MTAGWLSSSGLLFILYRSIRNDVNQPEKVEKALIEIIFA